MKFNTIDLFSGCGGFSLGAEIAGFHSMVAVDIDPVLQSSYKLNFPKTLAVQASVAEIDSSAWRRFLDGVRPDALIGGPPCQGFSRIGKRQEDDPRNSLIHHFYRHVDLTRPKFFIMENVEGLLDEDRVSVLRAGIDLVSSKYKVLEPFVVNAADFGVPTNRRRVIVIGYDTRYVDDIDVDLIKQHTIRKKVTVRQAISDLPPPITVTDKNMNHTWAKYPTKNGGEISEYAQLLRKKPKMGLGWEEAIEKQNVGYVSGVSATKHSAEIVQRYKDTKHGKIDPITKSYRLAWDGQSPTLRAGTGSDKGSFQAVRPLHPGKGRVITVREAARLQGFPDWFVFHPTKWHSFRMIGNSVSPMVAKGLFKLISKKM